MTLKAIGQSAQASLAPQTQVLSDGLACFAAVPHAGCIHTLRVVSVLMPRDLPEFQWINTMRGNLKTSLAGALHAFNYRKYADSYLSAFAYHFNHRFNLRSLSYNS